MPSRRARGSTCSPAPIRRARSADRPFTTIGSGSERPEVIIAAPSHPPPLPPELVSICERIARAGGRALVVGGYVRDHLLGLDPKDVDIEVFDLEAPALEDILGHCGEVITVGRAFGVYKVKGVEADFSLPRRDNKVAPGHRGFEVKVDSGLDFQAAAERRDFTVNSIGLDPLSGELLDPYGGEADLTARRLRATDPKQFAEDPLRGLRAAQFIARFELVPDDRLVELCRALDLTELPGERLHEEFRKLLLKGRRPSLGLDFLDRTELVRFFPELAALRGVAQDARWHPEGDVWVHTLMVVDQAAALRTGRQDEALMFAALSHDFGKPGTTRHEDDGRITAHGHEGAGVPVWDSFARRLRIGRDLHRCVDALIANHLAPALLVGQDASAKAYRKLARKLEAAGADIDLLVRVARADHLGRTTADAKAGIIGWHEPFLAEAAKALNAAMGAPSVLVSGRHLMARGLTPGPNFRTILEACREYQDETGESDIEAILDAVLGAGVRN